jgi:hypothetical protein
MLGDNFRGIVEPMVSSAGACSLALWTEWNESSDDRPQDALKILARRGGIYGTNGERRFSNFAKNRAVSSSRFNEQ